MPDNARDPGPRTQTALPVRCDERVFRCTSCHTDIQVCGHVDDIDEATYRGVVCGCRQPKPDPPAPATLAVAMEQAHAAATGKGIPY